MPNYRGSGNQPNGARRGQAPLNRGRGQGKNNMFAASFQPPIMDYQDTDDFLVIDFNDMSALSGTPSSSNRGSRGQGGYRGFGAHHIIPGPPQQNYRGQFTPPYRGRGRGRGGYTPIPVVTAPPPSTPPRSKQQQNGHSKHPLFRGRGGGLGFILSPERPGPKNWDLATRPLLKPIKFIRAKERLFEADPEELLQAHKIPPHPTDQLDPQTEMLAEVFEDQGQEPSARPTAQNSGQETPLSTMEIIKTGVSQQSILSIHPTEQITITQATSIETHMKAPQVDLLALLLGANGASGTAPEAIIAAHQEVRNSPPAQTTHELFYVDTTGNNNEAALPPLQVPLYQPLNVPAVGEDEEPDEVILVPSPAVRRTSSVIGLASPANISRPMEAIIEPPIVTMENLSLSFTKGDDRGLQNKSLKSFSVPRNGRSPFVPLRARKEAKRRPRDEAWTNSLGTVFGYKDGREGLRKGDSDLDVGSESAEEEELDDNGMDVDGDLDAFAMARFAREVNQPQMSMDDVVIEAALKAGDYDSESDGDEEDEDDVAMELNERIVLENGEDDDEDWSSDDDDDDVDMTPVASFKARLQKVRERTPAGIDAEDADVAINEDEVTWADRDEDFIAQIEDILDANADILGSKKDRKARNALFRAIQDGEADHPFAVVSSRYKNYQDVPELLAAQWLKDRNKKAERKRLREQERAAQAGLGNGKKKGKSRELDLEDIEQMMRDLLYATGPGAPKSFELPKLEKSMRERVHLMAQAMALKSSSSGRKNDTHKTMVISRTKNSGSRPVNEGKVNKVLRRKGDRVQSGPGGVGGIREGEVIGHKAAKIDQGNIGYRLLAQMGWTEGDKIGREGGLEAPIVAIMKKTKLGLGASFA